MTWLQKTAAIRLNRCENLKDLEESAGKLLEDLSEVISSKTEGIKSALHDYFEKSNLQEVIIQWQQAKLNALNLAAEQRYNEAKGDLLANKEARRIELLQTQKWTKHEVHIMKRATDLADSLKGKEVSESDLMDKFDAMWVHMANELATKDITDDASVALVMQDILFERFSADRKDVRSELRKSPLDMPFTHPSLEGSIGIEDVTSDDISLKTTCWDTQGEG